MMTSVRAMVNSSLLTDIEAYWKLDESSGTLIDATGHGNDLATSNSPTYGAAGKINTGITFLRTSTQYASMSFRSIFSAGNNNKFSVSAWVNLTDLVATQTILSCLVDTITSGWMFAISNEGKMLFLLSASTLSISNTVLSLGVWYHVCVTFDGVNVKFYLNGSLDYTNTGTLSPATGCTIGLGLGKSATGTNKFYGSGTYDEVGFWSRDLTATEALLLYNAGAGNSYPFIQ